MKSKDINFEYIGDFADYIVDRIENNEDLFISVVGKFDEIKNIIKEIFCIAEADFESINIESPIINNYIDEYVFDCWYDDGIVQIGCEPAKRDGNYLNLCGDETYILYNCSSKIIPLCESSDVYFVNIDDNFECFDECDDFCSCVCCTGDAHIECLRDEDGNPHGFIASKSDDSGYYRFNYSTSQNIEDKEIYAILKKFGFVK